MTTLTGGMDHLLLGEPRYIFRVYRQAEADLPKVRRAGHSPCAMTPAAGGEITAAGPGGVRSSPLMEPRGPVSSAPGLLSFWSPPMRFLLYAAAALFVGGYTIAAVAMGEALEVKQCRFIVSQAVENVLASQAPKR